MLALIHDLIWIITALVAGLICAGLGWLILRSSSVDLHPVIQFLLLFLFVVISLPIYRWTYNTLHSLANWALPWHYNAFSFLIAFVGASTVCVVYFFLLLAFLLKASRVRAIIAAILLGIISFPLFGFLMTLWLPLLI